MYVETIRHRRKLNENLKYDRPVTIMIGGIENNGGKVKIQNIKGREINKDDGIPLKDN